MANPRMPRFPMPLLPLPSWPDLPPAGTRLTHAQVLKAYEDLLLFSVHTFDAFSQLVDAWHQRDTQYHREAPNLGDAVVPRLRRERHQRDPDA